MKIRLTCIPKQPGEMVLFAQTIEAVGLDGVGVADSPRLHGATYPVVQHLLSVTSRIAVGPFVTNPLTRHPSVQAADLDAIESLFPGRLFYGVGTGDSAVSSIGMKAAPAGQVADCIDVVHERVGDRVPALFAVGGPKAAAAVPPTAAGVILGGGLDAAWSASLADTAERSAGRALSRWGFLVSSLGPESSAERRRRQILGSVTTVARHALAGDMKHKGVPVNLVAGLRDIFAAYDVAQHGRLDGPHHTMLDRYPAHCDYLLNRFAVVDSNSSTVKRLDEYAASLGLEGFYLSSTVSDQPSHARHVGAKLVPGLTGSAARPT